jgi:hypothetical protein
MLKSDYGRQKKGVEMAVRTKGGQGTVGMSYCTMLSQNK